jgi:glutamine synthetase adenylyltransferase
MEYSQKSVNIFAEDKELREYFLSKKVFEKLTNDSFNYLNIKQVHFILSVQYALGIIKYNTVSRLLSEFYKQIISVIAKENLDFRDFFIGGLGSFGSTEMTFASDIDLIFLVKKIDSKGRKEKSFQKLLQEIRKALSLTSVDCRLRPEGKSSLLAWEIESYSNYLKERARVWELQAFSKLTFVYGDKKLFNVFKKNIINRIKKEDERQIKIEIAAMRRRMYPQTIPAKEKSFNLKKSYGGLADIEFLLQYLMLTDVEFYKSCMGKPTQKIIQSLINRKKSYKELNVLIDNFKFLKNLELQNQVIFNNSLPMITDDEEKALLFSKKLGVNNVNEFRKNLNLTVKINQQLFNKYLDGNS